MPAGLSLASLVSLTRGWGPMVGVVALAAYVATDRAGVGTRLDALAQADTTTMRALHRDLQELNVKVDSLTAGQHQLVCYQLHYNAPGCR